MTDNALVDCKVTVEDMERVVLKITGGHGGDAANMAKLLKKPSMHFRLSVRGDEVATLTKKVYKSNCAMQTALAVVNVSLTFRAQVSQESFFKELQNLRSLVEECLTAAKQQPDVDSDSFSAQQSRNLENLAKAAQRFHTAASSTASTRHTFGGDRGPLSCEGSEFRSLTQAQRERIERWNDLMEVGKSPEDSLTGNTRPISADKPTATTAPATGDLPPGSGNGKGASRGRSEDDDHDENDDSDVELDFLRNFEELAYASFLAQDYPKAEQCLRMAVERSTGDRSSTAEFKLLKLKLALCCCLQEKWELVLLHHCPRLARWPISQLLTFFKPYRLPICRKDASKKHTISARPFCRARRRSWAGRARATTVV
ncbi:hypothetical protein VTK56DRAFT_3561 [Thermocarpiscus australiensis]